MGSYDCIGCGPFSVCSCGKVQSMKTRDGSTSAAVDMVNHPPHYQKPWGEVIDITENFNFCLGNALKYILRADDKGNFKQDIQKAVWYLNRELERRGL